MAAPHLEPAMKKSSRTCWILFTALLCSAPLAWAQLGAPTPGAAEAAAREIAADLREARELTRRVGDRATRERLELLLTRIELRALDLQKAAVATGPVKPQPTTPENFEKVLKAMQGESFDAGKTRLAGELAKTHHFSCEQLKQLLKLFSFDDGRVTAAVALHPRLTDPENFFTVLEVITFESSRQSVRDKLKIK
jgi:hypothetical protein